MRFALGMDNREIARALGRTDGATKVLLHRAIRQLEGIVADQRRGGGPVSAALSDFEALLREALAPIDPPEDVLTRLESRLVGLAELAQDELESWELVGDARSAQLDPAGRRGRGRRRGGHRAGRAARPLASPGTRQQSDSLLELAERTLQDIAEEARRIFPDR